MFKNKILKKIDAGLMAGLCAFTLIGANLGSNIKASAAEAAKEPLLSGDEVIRQAAQYLGVPYGWDCKGYDGVYSSSYYCVPSSYEAPDINIEFGRPEKCFFRLLTAPDFEKTEQSQWITMPCEKEKLSEIYDHVCLKFQSSLPMITNKNFESMKLVDELNFLAQELSKLSRDDFVKLKAVMESENINDISGAAAAIDRLSEYEFDQSVQDYNEFGITYLWRNLPTNFDVSALEDMNLYDFSMKILAQTGGEVTSYGALSGRGQELYSALTVQPEQHLEENFEEDIEEDFEMEMGGMSL